jgi:hypothetical protein
VIVEGNDVERASVLVATSLDGFIARENGGIDRLEDTGRVRVGGLVCPKAGGPGSRPARPAMRAAVGVFSRPSQALRMPLVYDSKSA